MNNDYIYRHVYPYEEEYLRRRWGSNPQAVSAAPDYQSGELNQWTAPPQNYKKIGLC